MLKLPNNLLEVGIVADVAVLLSLRYVHVLAALE